MQLIQTGTSQLCTEVRKRPVLPQKEPGLHKRLDDKADTSTESSSWHEEALASLPPTCTYQEQVLALWLQVWHNLLQPLTGPLGETALIVRQLGDSWPHGLTGCPQGPKDTEELVNLRVARKQGSAGHLEWGGKKAWGLFPCHTEPSTRREARPGRYLPDIFPRAVLKILTCSGKRPLAQSQTSLNLLLIGEPEPPRPPTPGGPCL